MERFYFLEELKDRLLQSSEKYVVDEPAEKDGVIFDFGICRQAIKEQPAVAAKILRVKKITDIDDIPEHIIASYKYEQDIITKQKYIRPDYYVVYYESSQVAVNLMGEKSAAVLINAGVKTHAAKKFYAVKNEIFAHNLWSTALKNAYTEKYGEDITEKLLMLFFKTSGSERFRGRYYSLIAELIKQNFLEPLGSIAHQNRAKLYGFTNCKTGIEKQVLPNINTIGFSENFDKVFTEFPNEVRKNAFIRLYAKYYTGVNRKKTVAKISYEDFCMLPLTELKLFIDRLFATGIAFFCIEDGIQNEILLKKRELLCSYINTLGAALNMGKKQTDCLVVYPSSTAMGEYAPDDSAAVKDYEAVINGQISALNQAHILYDIANENQLGNEIKISGALISAFGHTYTGLVLLSGYTVLPKTAGFIMKFSENGGRVYSLGGLPEKIDGFKSKKTAEITELIRRVEGSEMSLLRRSANPVFGNSQVDLYAASLDNNRMLYLASNISGGKVSFTSFDDILRLDTVSFQENPCVMSNKIGKVMGKQVIELNKNYHGTTLFITGKAKTAENTDDYTENLQISPYFDIVKTDANTLVLSRCNVRAGHRRFNNTTVFEALKKISAFKRKQSAEFCFNFTVANMNENTSVVLYFKNQEKFGITVNGEKIVAARGERSDITDYLNSGNNEIRLFCKNFGDELEGDENFLSNILLRGNFCVSANSPVHSQDDRVSTENDFTLCKMPEAISIERVLESGFWFFSGSMELSQKFEFTKQFDMRYMLELKRFCGLCMDVTLNGRKAGSMYLPPFRLDITSYLENGENEIKIVLYANQSNIRALQGEPEDLVYFEPFGAKILGKKSEAALIEVSEISKNFGQTKALDGVDFSVKAGEFTVIYGEKNSGKTTLLNILGGMEKSSGGTVSVNDVVINKLGDTATSAYRRKDVAFIFPSGNLIEGYSISDNIELACENKSQVMDISLALRSVGLGGRQNEKVSGLTEFEQKRVAIARALAKNPQIILCDEPTYNMTSSQAKQILHFLRETSRLTEKTVIVATDNDAVCDIADRVVRLKNGKVADESVNPMPSEIERIEL